MLYPEYNYVGYSKGGINKSPNFAKKESVDALVMQKETEYYQSIWRYTKETAEKLKILKGITKDILSYADYIVFDIDRKDDLFSAYTDTNNLIQYLHFIDCGYEVWFSGCKGFHVLVPTVQFGLEPTSNRSVLKQMAMAMAKEAGIQIDESIYDAERRFRMNGSFHIISNKYKIPVKLIERTSMDIILLESRSPMPNPFPDADDYVECEALKEIYKNILKDVKVNRKTTQTDDVKNTRLFNAWQDGNRNDSCYKFARSFARRGVGKEDCRTIALMWNEKQNDPLMPSEVERTVESAYTKGMNEIIDESNMGDSFFNSKKALRHLINQHHEMKNNEAKTGYDFIDDYTEGFAKGEVIYWLSRPGNFKTCILSNFIQRISKRTGKTCVIFSMEMSVEALTKRHIQLAEHITQNQLKEKINLGFGFDSFTSEFSNVEVVNISNLTVDQVIGMLDWFIEEKGELGAIGFDYLSLFKGCAASSEATGKVATELKSRIAKVANCPVFVLVQASRKFEGEDGNIEITKDGGKDSSYIEDSGDYLIGSWRHKDEQGNVDFYGRFLKSRRYNDTRYWENPYFKINLNKPHMEVKDIELVIIKPEFKQKAKEY